MSLLDSLTAPKWQHKNPQVRIQAVSELEDKSVLLQLVNSDPDPEVQAAALARIDNPGILDELAESLTGALQKQARQQRLGQLLPATEKIANIEDDAVLVQIAGLADQAGLSAAAMGRVKNPEVRLDVAINHPLARVRLEAARGIEDPEALKQLMSAARDHDKGVFRYCKQRLDEHQARLDAEDEKQEKIRLLGDRVHALLNSPDAPDYESRLKGLVQQWDLIKPTADPEQSESIRGCLEECSQRAAELTATRQATLQATLQAEQAQAAARQELRDVIESLQNPCGLGDAPSDRDSIDRLRTELGNLKQRWEAAGGGQTASAEQSGAYAGGMRNWGLILKTAGRLLENEETYMTVLDTAANIDAADHDALRHHIGQLRDVTKTLAWPADSTVSQPEMLARLNHACDQLLATLQNLEIRQETYLAREQKAIEKLTTALNQKQVRTADRALNKARKTLKSLHPNKRQHFENALRPLAARLNEMHDWQEFAVEPKKEELCAGMEALIGSMEDAETLAAKIRALQKEWKQLRGLPNAREHALWERFKSAADEAWKPCQAAFDAQAQVRRENLRKRMELVAQLTEYEARMAWPDPPGENTGTNDETAGPAPDWRMVQKTLDAARAAFKAITPLSPKGERSSHKAFGAICDRIYGHIKEEYGRNIALKQSLAEQAQELGAAEDLSVAIESAKRLQRQWKEVGITPVAVDRKLWKKFRAGCDAVFARLDEQRAENRAETDACIKQAEALRDQARALLESDSDGHGPGLVKAVAELKQQMYELDLPPKVRQRLSRDFQGYEKAAREAIGRLRARKEGQSWEHLLEKMQACALKAKDELQATALWEKAGELPRGIESAALETWWREGTAEGAGEELRDACIGLEVLAEIDSPPEDKKARMDYQMRRLVAGMGNQILEPEQALLDSINAFVALRPTASWLDRFAATLRKIRERA